MNLIPRDVAFDDQGKGIVVGVASAHYSNRKVIFLPTDHYDFIGPIDVRGKTEAEIAKEVDDIMKQN